MRTLSIPKTVSVSVEDCPFCASSDITTRGAGSQDFHLVCTNCGAQGPNEKGTLDPIDGWNSCIQNKQKEIKAAVDLAVADALTALPVVTDVKPA